MPHAKLSPSGAYRWSHCTAAPMEEAGKPDDSNEHSRWGTAAHLVASECLEKGLDPESFIGFEVLFCRHDGSDSHFETLFDPVLGDGCIPIDADVQWSVPVDDEMIECVATYVGYVRDLLLATNGELHVEQRVPIDHITGEEGAGGTSDTVILARDTRTIYIVDLKGGKGVKVDAFEIEVEVDPWSNEPMKKVVPNLQLAMYAGGTIKKFASHGEFDSIVMIIVQPRLNHISEHRMSIADLNETLSFLSERARETYESPTHRPRFDVCHFCKAKKAGTCKAVERLVLETALEGFEDVTTARAREVSNVELGHIKALIPLIKSWCEDMDRKVYETLLSGEPVIGGPYGGWKLVKGSDGDRYWVDPEAVAFKLQAEIGLEEGDVYTKKIKGPAQIEDLTKKKRGSKTPPKLPKDQWEALQALIDRQPGKPVVAPLTDEREPYQSATEGLSDLGETAATSDDINDLF